MRMENAKVIYSKIGLSQGAIKNRIDTTNKLLGMNTDQDTHLGYHVKGMATDMSSCMQGVSGNNYPLIAKNDAEHVALAALAKDADSSQFNIPSSGVPSALTTIWTTRMIEQMFKSMTLSKVAGSWQQGKPGNRQIMIPTIGYNGESQIYSDNSAGGNTSINVDWVERSVLQFEQSMSWGDMQQATFSLAKIPYVDKLREALGISVAQKQNDIGFNGYTDIPSVDKPKLFGVLNEINLNPAISLPADGFIPGTVTPTTSWSGKTFNQISRDFRLLMSEVIANTVGHVDFNAKGVFLLPSSSYTALTTPNSLSSITVKEYINKTFPNIELVQCPNFEAEMVTSGQSTKQAVCMLLIQHPNGQMPFDELFITKWLGHRNVPLQSSISEKMSYILGGVVLKYPAFVSFAYGV